MISLQELREAYGDISAAGIIERWKNFSFGEKSFETKPTENITANEDFKNALQVTAPSQENFSSPVQNYEMQTRQRRYIDNKIFQPTVSTNYQNKFSPVNIKDMEDWTRLRATALDLHELKNFFEGRQDNQSQYFISLIDSYKKYVEKNLKFPDDIDAESSSDFVSKLATVIEKRFYTILDSVTRGKAGKADQPQKYYQEIDLLIKQYFERIGLKSEKVKIFDNFKNWQDNFEIVTAVPSPEENMKNKIYEIFIQPHYFEYYDNDGEVEKLYISGKCSIYGRV